jgi:hypothetical protein
MSTPEERVKSAVMDYLWKKGHLVLPHKTQATYDTKLGIYRKPSAKTLTPGESDLLVFAKSSPISPIWIELKAKKGTLRPDQRLFKDMVEEWGHEYAVVRSVDDLIALGL